MNFENWYNKKAKSYKNKDRKGTLRYKIALKTTPVENGMKIVDIGCKTLSLLNFLDKNYENTKYYYTGIDISQVALERNKLKKEDSVRIILKDVMEGIPIEKNSIDRVFCLEVIEHVHTPIFLLQEIQRVLKKDGLAIISCPNPYYWVNMLNSFLKRNENEGHISSFRFQEIQTLCDFTGLKIVNTKKTFMSFPPIKSSFRVLLRNPIGLFSESIQYYLSKN